VPARSDVLRPTTACLVVAYATDLASGATPAVDEVLTMWPWPCARINA